MMVDIEQMILPTPGRSFEWRLTANGPGLVCRDLEPFASHLFTSRQWVLGLPAAIVDDPTAWEDVGLAVGLGPGMLRRVRQVHGNTAVVASANGDLKAADIIITRDSALGVAVQAADCVPLLFADRKTGAVAAAHAGWRGLAAGVPQAVVNALSRAFGSRAVDLVVAAGPSIGACCYEVGLVVRDAFASAGFSPAELERWFLDSPARLAGNPPMPGLPIVRRHDHWFFDGWAAARAQLERAGVPPNQIFASELCTASHPDVLCSYRRDGARAGRLAAVISPQALRP
jgi:YfiH family protein